MANVQVEKGHLKIADGLVEQFAKNSFSSYQLRILLAIMNLTYRVGKTKAAMSLYDLQVLTGIKKYRVEQSFCGLVNSNVIFLQETTGGRFVVGLVKDFDQWNVANLTTHLTDTVPQMCRQEEHINIITYKHNKHVEHVKHVNTSSSLPQKGSTPVDQFLSYLSEVTGIGLAGKKLGLERAKAKQLYSIALKARRDQGDALGVMKDYLDSLNTPEFRSKVNYPVAYLLANFEKYAREIPQKPKMVQVEEKQIGRRSRWDFGLREWVTSRDKL